jgi:hypothetical protein
MAQVVFSSKGRFGVDSCHEVAIALSPGFQPWEIELKELSPEGA